MKTDGDELSGSKAAPTVPCLEASKTLSRWQITGFGGGHMEITCSWESLWLLMEAWSANIADKQPKPRGKGDVKMMNRRRFLALSAAALAAPAQADALAATRHDWAGTALGAEARLTLSGATDAQARRVFAKVARVLAEVEAQFSLHRDTALTRLNRDGHLAYPAPAMLALFAQAGRVHQATGGVFDPSVQPLWLATATGGDLTVARDAIGWDRVRITADEIRLDPGMALTFNGIAQGHAADRIAALMQAEGFGDVLIDMGEVRALGLTPGGGPWQARIAGPDGTGLGDLDLRDRALATSSPMGTRIGAGLGHILRPDGRPARWNTVSISAPEAAIADALSTAACLMDRAEIDAALQAFPGTRLEHLS